MREREESSTLTDLFWRVARTLRTLSRDSLSEWDITPAQSRALSVVDRHGSLRPSTLSEHLRIAPRSGTEVVDALEDRRLITRRPDAGDRRATLVELTAAGADLVERLQAARAVEADAYFARLSATDRNHLIRILRTLADD